MKIRLMDKLDKDIVFDMMRVFYNSPAIFGKVADEVLKRNIDDCINDVPYLEGYVFEENQMIIGYSMIAKSYSTEYGGMCLWIEDIYIVPQQQGKGLSTQFFRFLEELYKDKAVRFRLEVAKSNTNAIKSYEKVGFKKLTYTEMTKEF